MNCRGAEILKLRVEGVPLGLLEAREYDEVTFHAETGDALLLSSDGITDHLNSTGQEFGRGLAVAGAGGVEDAGHVVHRGPYMGTRRGRRWTSGVVTGIDSERRRR